MLTMRAEQMSALGEVAFEVFLDQLCLSLAAMPIGRLAGAGLRRFCHVSAKDARRHGLEGRSDIALYVALDLQQGHGQRRMAEQDWAVPILGTPGLLPTQILFQLRLAVAENA